MLIGRMASIAECANSDVWQGCRASADGNEKGFDKAQPLKPDRGRAGEGGSITPYKTSVMQPYRRISDYEFWQKKGHAG